VVLTGLSATASMLTPVDSGPLRMLCCDWNQYASTDTCWHTPCTLGWLAARLEHKPSTKTLEKCILARGQRKVFLYDVEENPLDDGACK
jgi:hypothetical protein